MVLSRYQILKPLGRGAAGGVFLALDRLRPGRPLALKRIHARADELLRASFEREFAVLSAISAPGVGRVFDFGLAEAEGDDEGGPFFTRSYAEGEPLDDVAHGLSEKERLSLFAALLRVMAPVHRMGIAHGDLKPSNVIVDSERRPHVIDFGLAGLTTDQGRAAGAGTPAYMAPELFRGERPSVASDVYALGATLWSLFAGGPPFAERGERGLAARLEGELPQIPSDASERARSVLAVAQKALAADPLERISTTEEMLAALAEHVPESDGPGGAFVAPRPRGHEGVLAQLDARVTARTAGKAGDQSMLLVHAPRGGGKSTLLRELKWRMQVRGLEVLAVDAGHGRALEPVHALLSLLSMILGDEGDAPLPTTEAAICDAVGEAIGRLAARGPAVILVDDLDQGESVLGRALRLGVHAEEASRVALVGTATDLEAVAVRDAGARHLVEVPPLSEEDTTGLCRTALGPVDSSVTKAIWERSEGVPGILVDTLSELASRTGLSAADVEALPASQAGEAAARSRASACTESGRRVLSLLAATRVALDAATIASAARVSPADVDEVERAGLVVRDGDRYALFDHALRSVLLDELTAEEVQELASKTASAADDLPLFVRAQLAAVAGDGPTLRELAEPAATELATGGAAMAALSLLEEVEEELEGEDLRRVKLTRSELAHALGRYPDASATAREVLRDQKASATERARAGIAAGRASISAGEFERALDTLGRIPDDAPAELRAAARREAAKAHLRLGNYDEVVRVADEGLSLSGPEDPVRVELLTSAGMASSYRGDRDAARARYTEALSLARAIGSTRDEANVMTYMAIDRHRSGDHHAAKQLYEESMKIARDLGDIGSMATFALNLGAVSYDLGLPGKAAESYESAARLARRAGKASTEVMARINLAQLHLYLGLYERARTGTDSALHDAEESGMKAAAANAVAILGDISARTGDVETALVRYDDAIARYRGLGHRREVAEGLLDSAEALLDRAGPADTSAAVSRLAEAREMIGEHSLTEFESRLTLLLARARGDTGDIDGAVGDLEKLLERARESAQAELEWSVLGALGKLNAMRGADFVARRQDQEAMEVLESIATKLPRDLREAFWHDPRRREVRRRAGQGTTTNPGRALSSTGIDGTFHGVGIEARTARLLELIKRLASEHDLDRLLERITDCAVELSGAERGFVLLVGRRR